jgi:hypothetical protein
VTLSLKVRQFRKLGGQCTSVTIFNVARRDHAAPLVAMFEGKSYMAFHVAIVPIGGSFDVCLETLRADTTPAEITEMAVEMLAFAVCYPDAAVAQ